MRQASLKIRGYASNINIIDSGNLHRRIFYIMFSMLLILVLFYVLFLGNMVFNIVARKTIEKEALRMESDVLALEREHLILSKEVDLTMAHFLGFKETDKHYVTRGGIGNFVSVTAANDEI